jgi:hypothetical protein
MATYIAIPKSQQHTLCCSITQYSRECLSLNPVRSPVLVQETQPF